MAPTVCSVGLPPGYDVDEMGVLLDKSEQLGKIDRPGYVSGGISRRDRGAQLVEGGRTGRAGLGFVDPAGEPDWRIVVDEGVHSVYEHGGRARESMFDGVYVVLDALISDGSRHHLGGGNCS